MTKPVTWLALGSMSIFVLTTYLQEVDGREVAEFDRRDAGYTTWSSLVREWHAKWSKA